MTRSANSPRRCTWLRSRARRRTRAWPRSMGGRAAPTTRFGSCVQPSPAAMMPISGSNWLVFICLRTAQGKREQNCSGAEARPGPKASGGSAPVASAARGHQRTRRTSMIFPLRSGSGRLLAHVAALRPLARIRAAVVLCLSVGEGCRRLAAGRHERGGRLPHSEGVGAIKVSAAISLFAAGVFAASLLAFLPRPTMGKGAPPAGREDEAGRLARVVELRIDDVVEPVLAEYISNGIEEAAKSEASLVLITMNTPGGLDSAMREIIQHIIRSPIPVAVYVAPSGSRAASAGFFILLSSDIAVMAPGTDTGAASPLLISILSGAPAQIDETLKRKILNGATAALRSLTNKRGRNVELAEKAVTEAKAFSEKEALEGRLIDMIARSPEELLAQLNGRKITRFDGSTVTLDLRNPSRTAIEMTSRQRLLSYFVRPDVLFILLILGILGLYAEFTHPGMVFPGVIGGIALLLALYGMRVLPVNQKGVLVIALAALLFILVAD